MTARSDESERNDRESTEGASAPKGRRRRRRRRAALITLAVVLGTLAIGMAVVARSPLVGSLVRPRLERALGCAVNSAHIRLNLSGDLVLEGPVFRAPGVDGPAGEFLSAARIIADVDWAALLRGGATPVRGLRVERSTLRLSRSAVDGSFNIGALLTGGAGGAPTALPAMEVSDGIVTFGEHDAQSFDAITEIRVDGRLYAPDPARPFYALKLQQRRVPGATEMRLDGGVDLESGSGWIEMNGLDLAQFNPAATARPGVELWRQLGIKGSVPRASLRYDPATGVAAELRLAGVDLTMPVPAPVDPDSTTGRSEQWMRMRRVDGSIRFDAAGLHADVSGLVEDLPGRVRLETRGLSLLAALRCEIVADRFYVSEQPRLLPFAPLEVHDVLEEFSGPTAVVSGTVVLTRGEPLNGAAAPIEAAGSITFEHGVAAQRDFPYPVTELTGRIGFTGDRIEIVKITGIGPTGARLLAEGWIEPGSRGKAEISITAVDVPLDEHLVAALPEARRVFAAALCNEGFATSLREQGLTQSADARRETEERLSAARRRHEALAGGAESAMERVALEREIADLERSAAVPVFETGGLAEISIALRRERGEKFTTSVHVAWPTIGVLPERFPYPVLARNMSLDIARDGARVAAPALEGLTGARGRFEATLTFDEQDEARVAPDVSVHLEGAPLDALMLFAVAHAAPREGAGAQGPAEIIGRLGLTGAVDADVRVLTREDGSVGHRADVAFKDLASHPEARAGTAASGSGAHAAAEPPAALTEVEGRLTLTDDGVSVGPVSGRIGEGRFELTLDAAFADEDGTGGRLEALVNARDINLGAPLERVVGAVAPDVGEKLSRVRDEARLDGFIDAVVRLERAAAGELRADAAVTNARGVSFDIPSGGGRLTLARSGGEVHITNDRLRFDGFGGEIAVDGAPFGEAVAQGEAGFGAGAPTDLTIDAKGLRFEASIIGALVRERVGGVVEKWFRENQPRGEFDAMVRLLGAPAAGGGGEPGPAGAIVAEGWVAPRRITITPDGLEGSVRDMEGRITFDRDGGGLVERLSGKGAGWSFEGNGAWWMGAAPGADVTLTAAGAALGEDLLAFLPRDVREAAGTIGLEVAGGFALEEARLIAGKREEAEADETGRFTGRLRFAGVSLDAGVRFEELVGAARVDARMREGAAVRAGDLSVEVDATSFRAAGLRMTSGRATFRSGDEPGAYVIPEFAANVYGGRISARAGVFPAGSASTIAYADAEGMGPVPIARPRFQVDVRAAGVDLAQAVASTTGDTGAAAPDSNAGEDGAKIEATMSIAGALGDRSATRGRGMVTAHGGRIVRLPLLLPILEVANLQPPSGEGLDRAEASFYLDGRRLVFERLLALSGSIVVLGEGEAAWPDLELDLRFKTSGRVRLPLVSDLLDALKHELITITVRGTLQSPEVGSTQLPATRRMLDEMFRGAPARRDEPAPTQPRRPAGPGDGD